MVHGHVSLDQACSKTFLIPEEGGDAAGPEELKSVVSAMTTELRRTYQDVDPAAADALQGPAFQRLLWVLAGLESSAMKSDGNNTLRPTVQAYSSAVAAIIEMSVALLARWVV
jgi:hypothetical protein